MPVTDIVEKLKAAADACTCGPTVVCEEAASEIERLRSALAAARKECAEMAEKMTERRRRMEAVMNATGINPCEIAAAIMAMGSK